ncbi:MAG: EAL domain-containing response regulator [Gemmatimonadaceae bacterium]|nr:EAL domain-containing response regulator [Gemmatimonadaceae bacterium]
MKIFVIDDEPFTLRLVGHQLRALGHTEVTTHAHAALAVQALEQDPAVADVILLDLQMPEMDGVEFVRHLARLRFSGAIILVSGEDERIVQTASRLATAHALNVLGALNKPVQPEELRRLLDATLAPKAPPRPVGKLYGPAELAAAIAGGQMVNHYQPKVQLATGLVVGVETLVRWQHPTDGLVFPEQFISVAEEHQLIDALTRTVLTEALQQARRWLDGGATIAVAVNVSMDNLSSLDFPDVVDRAIRAAGVSNKQIMLEVTEGRLMTDAVLALDTLTRLRLKQIGLSIDDFGTGNSTMTQLRNIPFVELKIDRSFVHGADRDIASRAIVDASLAMARRLGLQSVAEGVEVLTDWHQMRAMGCDIAQGFFIARPMPADQFDAWLTGWNEHRSALIQG